MNRKVLTVLATAACATMFRSTSLAATTGTIENFEEYTNRTTLAASGVSGTSWTISGSANNGAYTSLTTPSNAVLDGTSSGDLPTAWGTTGANTLDTRFVLSGATDYSNATSASVKVEATTYSSATYPGSTNTTSQIQLELYDSVGNIFASTTPQALKGTVQTLSFTISAATMTAYVDTGAETFASFISHITQVGFRFSNSSATPTVTSEHMLLDDLAVTAPEPASAAILFGFAVPLMCRRRR